MDDGSTKTYVNTDDATELRLEGTVELLQVKVINRHCEMLEMELQSLDGNTKTKVNAFTANQVTGNMRFMDWRPLANKWKHLRNITFSNIGPKPIVDVLIGIDCAELHCALEELTEEPGEPTAQ